MQVPSATGAVQCSAAQRRVVSGSFLSSMSDAMALALSQVCACPCLPQPRAGRAGQNWQVPNTACDSRGLQYSVPRTNLHTSLSTSLIRLVSFVQVRALLQIQIELDPHAYPQAHPHPVPVNVPFGQGSLWSHPIWVDLGTTRPAAATLAGWPSSDVDDP